MSIKSCILILALTGALIPDVYGRRRYKISGGNQTTVEEHPSIVSIRFHGRHICGGTLITPRHVLTAGHCLCDDDDIGQGVIWYPKNLITVASGTSNCYYPEIVHQVKTFTIHPEYNGSYNHHINDLGIIELREPVKFDKVHQIAKLRNESTPSGVEVTVVGWGTSYEGEEKPSEKLQKAKVVTISNQECARRIRSFIHAGQICTSQRINIGFCDGDSGGPLYDLYENIVGVVSASIHCAEGWPDIYIRPSFYSNWINATIAKGSN